MPFINIALKEGRTKEVKAKIAEEITKIIAENLKIDPEKVWIRFDEFARENFATNGKLDE